MSRGLRAAFEHQAAVLASKHMSVAWFLGPALGMTVVKPSHEDAFLCSGFQLPFAVPFFVLVGNPDEPLVYGQSVPDKILPLCVLQKAVVGQACFLCTWRKKLNRVKSNPGIFHVQKI